MMPPRLYQIAHIGCGQLFTMAKPVGTWIDEEIYALKNAGIEVILSLLTKEEEQELQLQTESAICHSHTIEFFSYPIQDRKVPVDRESLFELVEKIYRLVHSGSNTAIHCRAGIGRASVLAALVMIHHHITAEDAFKIISQSRGLSVPDTKEQYQFVVNYEKWVANKIPQ